MKIAYTTAPGHGDTDQLLFALAQDLASLGYRTCGTVQINTDCGAHRCDMDVQVLPDGPVLRISQSLGAKAQGCRLDPSALETAVGLVAARLDRGADVLIINKFGKHEADGRGFRTVIAAALSADVPVIVGLNAFYVEPFHAFAGDTAVDVKPTQPELLKWLQGVSNTQVDPLTVNS